VTRKATQRSRGITRLAAARRTCVDGPELAWARRPLQHPELMAENEDLEVLGSVGSTSPSSADEETDEGADDEVEEGQHRPIVPGLSERESGFPTSTGCVAIGVGEDVEPHLLLGLDLTAQRSDRSEVPR